MSETAVATKHFTNRDVSEVLDQMADMLQIAGANRFRFIAFQNAAEAIRTHSRDVNDVAADGGLQEIPGIGKGIAQDIHDLLESGTFEGLEALRKEVPAGVLEMLQIPDVGPKTVRRMWQELDILDIASLKAAAEAEQIRVLKGFGTKSEEKILKGIELLAKRADGRTPIGKARPLAEEIKAALIAALPSGTIERIEIAGSLRRWRETIGDLDFLVISEDPAAVMDAFRTLPLVVDVIGSGETKTSILLGGGLQADLRVVAKKHWGAALQYFTGSQGHNIAVREIAQKQGWSLNEYCLTATGSGKAAEGEERFFEEEAALYAFLNLAWVPPEMRENRGEVKAASSDTLPSLVQLTDIRGELHGHSTYSDGAASVAEMAAAAQARGYSYWAICDHSVGLGVTDGVDAEQLAKQAEEIVALNQKYEADGVEFRLLRGIEVEVLADGTLGLPDEVLAELDVVVGSIHSGQRQAREVITERCLKVVRNPHVDILGHPTGRIIGKRAPSDLDVEQVLQTCLETGTVVEINAHPSRLDLNDVYARRAIELGCKLAISSDAHSTDGMEMMQYGIATAQRAWVQPADVINTLPMKEMLAALK